MNDRIEEIRKRESAATTGPWTVETMRPHTLGPAWVNAPTVRNLASCGEAVSKIDMGWFGMVPHETMEANASFIAHARSDIPFLLSALDELKVKLERTERNRDMWRGQCERQAKKLAEIRETSR